MMCLVVADLIMEGMIDCNALATRVSVTILQNSVAICKQSDPASAQRLRISGEAGHASKRGHTPNTCDLVAMLWPLSAQHHLVSHSVCVTKMHSRCLSSCTEATNS